MYEHSNSKNSNYSNFSFANYLKNPADIGKNEYENYSEYTESFFSLDNNQNENIPKFGVDPKSAGIGLSTNNENADKIELVDYTKPVPQATSLNVTGLSINFITQSAKNTEFVPHATSLNVTGLGPNFITQSAKNTEFVPHATSLNVTGLNPNFITQSAKNTEFLPFYNTGLMLNNFNASKTEPLHEISSKRESHKSSGFEKFLEFTGIDEIINELKQLIISNQQVAKEIKNSNQVLVNEIKDSNQVLVKEIKNSNQVLVNEIKNSNQVLVNEIKNSNQVLVNEIKNSNQMLANEIKIVVKALNDSVQNQTELTSSIKSLVEELKKNKNN